MNCENCGAEIREGKEFCGECGAVKPGSKNKKGGGGIIILMGLGVLLLIIIFIIGSSQGPESISPPTSSEIVPITTTNNLATSDYLIGDWSKSDKSYAITFYSDGSFLTADKTASTSYAGIYTLTGSKILLTFNDGSQASYILSYIDPNTFKMGDAVYGRDITESTIDLVTSDYLIGDWSKSDMSSNINFYSDGSFLSTVASTSYVGRFTVTGSKIILTFEDGSQISYALSYIDPNTFKMGDAVYVRI